MGNFGSLTKNFLPWQTKLLSLYGFGVESAFGNLCITFLRKGANEYNG